MGRKIIYKTEDQVNNIREAGKYLTELLLLTREKAQPGVSLIELEEIAQAFMDKNRVHGAFKGYEGFPANLCTSVNDCVVHGIPDKTILKDGDLLKIDAGVVFNKNIADAAYSVVIGGADKNPKAQQLIDATRNGLDHAMQYVQPNKSMFAYSKAVYEYITKQKCSVIKYLTGHGVGVKVHEAPNIFNWPNGDMQKQIFEPGMVIALEPITAFKSTSFKEKKGIPRNIYTKKDDLGAQWEYTVIIHGDRAEIVAGIQPEM